MIESFVITLREGIEASLVMAVTLAYLRRSGRAELVPSALWGLAAAAAASLALAVVFLRLELAFTEAWEGFLYLAAAAMVGTLVFFMARAARRPSDPMMDRLDSIVGRPTAGQRLACFVFVFFMVGREGLETVLMLAASWIGASAGEVSSEGLLILAGGLAGIGLAVLFAVLLSRGAIRIRLVSFFKVTTIALGVFAAQLLINGVHELSEAGFLPASRQSMAIIGPLVKHKIAFVLIILFLPVATVVLGALRSSEEIDTAANPAERRLAIAARRRRGLGAWAVAVVGLVIAGALAYDWVSSMPAELPPPVLVSAEGGVVRVPVPDAKDRSLHRYGLVVGDKLVRFLVMRVSDDRVGTAFDACEICGDSGYFEEDGHVVCRNCTADINPLTLGEPGGCNPIPLASSSVGGALEIRQSDLAARKDAFHPAEVPAAACPVCGMGLANGSRTIDVDGKKVTICTMESCEKQIRRK